MYNVIRLSSVVAWHHQVVNEGESSIGKRQGKERVNSGDYQQRRQLIFCKQSNRNRGSWHNGVMVMAW
jgi:hypothetical protein